MGWGVFGCYCLVSRDNTVSDWKRLGTDTATPWGWGGWWKHPDSKPSPAELLAYLREVTARVEAHMAALTDADVAEPFDTERENGATRLGHYIYALRHTMLHHGALSLLALQAGYPEGHWE